MVFRLPFVVRLAMGILMSSLIYSCANSVQNELSEAVASLTMLENSDAVYYVKDELQSVRSLIEKSHSQIKLRDDKLAESTLSLVLTKLDDISAEYYKRKQSARLESQKELLRLEAKIASLATELKAFPHKTYVDQNRHDRIRYNLHLAKKHLDHLQQVYSEGMYQKIVMKKEKVENLLVQVESIFVEYESQRIDTHELTPDITTITSQDEPYTEVETINLSPGND
ncbi:hypothetical protein KC799_00580 [candidate division KSB1 bacterium]|nr:hypothetical protein [candidate division KSB1 bacterium]